MKKPMYKVGEHVVTNGGGFMLDEDQMTGVIVEVEPETEESWGGYEIKMDNYYGEMTRGVLFFFEEEVLGVLEQ